MYLGSLFFFLLKIEGEESHARMSGMHVRMFHIFCENITSYIMNIIHARNIYSFYPIFRHPGNFVIWEPQSDYRVILFYIYMY
jgi:hypothetical protein